MALQNALGGLALDSSITSEAVLLRRIAKALETLAVVDGSNRQRIVVDSITAGLTLATITTVGTVTTVSTVSSVTNLAAIASDPRPLLDLSRIGYNTGIRSKIN